MQACLNIFLIPNITSIELKVNKESEAQSHLLLCLLPPT